MKHLVLLLSINSFLFHTIIKAQTVNFLGGNICPTESWKLVFQDEFTGSSLDQSKWITYYPYGPNGSDQCEFCRTHGNGESQIYKDNNVVVGNGIVKLIAKNEYSSWYSAQRNYTSGMIHSKSNFSFMYGKFEIRCKIPNGAGLWPAFWTMGGNGTEIDCFEIKGGNPSNHFMTIHKWVNGVNNETSYNYSGVDFSQDFHIYSVVWDPFFITFFVDNFQVWKINRYFTLDGTPVMWCDVAPGVYLVLPTYPSGENNYVSVIANLAIGGWAGAVGSNVSFPKQLEIDYIRVFQRNPQPGFTDLCLQNTIIGNQIICNTGQYSFSFSGPNQYVSSWNVSSNLTIISSTTSNVIVKATNSYTNGSGWIQAIFTPTQPCQNSVTKTIWIGKPIPVITGPLSLRKGSERVYHIENSSTQSILNYQWDAEPGLTAIGSTSSSTFRVKGISCPDGSITCTVSNVCGSGIADYFVEVICLQDLTLSIFPNPVNDILTIKINNQNIESLNIDLELYIFNNNQKLLFNSHSNDLINQYDLTFLPIGDYILRIKLNDKIQESHLLIRR